MIKKRVGPKSIVGVIPARYGSTRFPGKPLAKLHGKPMIQWVFEAARAALPRVVIATDDFRIQTAAEHFGAEVMLTPNSCTSGTDRMAYVARKIPAQFYVNVQGDEPLMNPESIRAAVALAVKKQSIATVATDLDEDEKSDPSSVKVVLGHDGRALYFSRTMIPFAAHGVTHAAKSFKHLGLYVYPRISLLKFVKWEPSELEQTEKLEQLRALYYGAPIFVAYTQHDSIGVDTPEDLKKVEQILKGDNS